MKFKERIEQMEAGWREELKAHPENCIELQQELKERYRALFALEQVGDDWNKLKQMFDEQRISQETFSRASQVLLGS